MLIGDFFGPRIYSALSKVKTFEFNRSSIKISSEALKEYEHLKEQSLLSAIDKNAAYDETLTKFILNVRLLSKHAADLVINYRVLKNDTVGFTETIRFY